jgi:hypothetical protein
MKDENKECKAGLALLFLSQAVRSLPAIRDLRLWDGDTEKI